LDQLPLSPGTRGLYWGAKPPTTLARDTKWAQDPASDAMITSLADPPPGADSRRLRLGGGSPRRVLISGFYAIPAFNGPRAIYRAVESDRAPETTALTGYIPKPGGSGRTIEWLVHRFASDLSAANCEVLILSRQVLYTHFNSMRTRINKFARAP